MKVCHVFLCSFLLYSTITYSQPGPNVQFKKYARECDSIFYKLYEKRDVKTYQNLLTEFLSKYKSLPAEEQKAFAGTPRNAWYNLSCAYSLIDNKPMALETLEEAIHSG